jgi:hypothetical protein
MPPIMHDYELRLDNGKTATWNGTTAEDAAQRYANSHPDRKVLATRQARADAYGVFAWGGAPIVEPGDQR